MGGLPLTLWAAALLILSVLYPVWIIMASRSGYGWLDTLARVDSYGLVAFVLLVSLAVLSIGIARGTLRSMLAATLVFLPLTVGVELAVKMSELSLR